MLVEGYCTACRKEFDAHWDKVGMFPKCPFCGSTRLIITTDESNDPPADFESPRGDDYEPGID